eukprot:TRINITY_DN2807_c0_g1_i3.p1 TRINITY_DN2807_c0_g1~~TRINITY_DN2807_c0_g1_i3.p1  ORF type:complete len:565 (+),score=43.01 TRINITY_DN2807_c0_g1_i3:77-1771(+)
MFSAVSSLVSLRSRDGIPSEAHMRSASAASGRSRDKRILTLDLEKDILRGVGLETVLTRFGRAFSSGVSEAHDKEGDVQKSFEVDSLDDFISHDWESGRFQKTLTLCMIYNSRAAMTISAIAALCLCALQSVYVVLLLQGDGMWAQILCPMVFLFVFLTWQDLRAACKMGNRRVFLDKYCIDQHDPDRKAKGILGLGGFLINTKRIVICWTPSYFKRLWCNYEIATWLYLGKGHDHVLLMPLATTSIVLTGFALSNALCLGFHFLSKITDAYELILGGLMLVVAPIAAHASRHLENVLKQLPSQLKDFSVTKAACFCCTQAHKMPGTGAPLACDRKLVYKTLQKWFPLDDNLDDRAESCNGQLDIVDEEIKSLFGPFMLQRMGPSALHYKYALLVAQPFLWRTCDVIVWHLDGRHYNHVSHSVRVLLEFSTLVFCVVPCSMKLMMHTGSAFENCFGIPKQKYVDVLISMCCGFICLVINMSCWFSVYYPSASENTTGLCISSAMWFFFLTPLIFRKNLPSCLRRASSSKTYNSACVVPEFHVDSIPDTQSKEALSILPSSPARG